MLHPGLSLRDGRFRLLARLRSGALLAWMRTGGAPGHLFVPEALATLGERLRAAGGDDGSVLSLLARCGRYAPDCTTGAPTERRGYGKRSRSRRPSAAEAYRLLPAGVSLARWKRRAAAALGAHVAWSGCLRARGPLDGRALHTVRPSTGTTSPGPRLAHLRGMQERPGRVAAFADGNRLTQ